MSESQVFQRNHQRDEQKLVSNKSIIMDTRLSSSLQDSSHQPRRYVTCPPLCFSKAFLYSAVLCHIEAACPFRGLSRLGSPSRDWIESKIVRTLYAADHFSFRMSRQMLPYWSTFGWKHPGGLKVTVGASNGYCGGNLKVTLKVRPS